MQDTNHEPKKLRAFCRALFRWAPAPIPSPGIDPHVGWRPPLERAAEVLRYRLHCLEHTLSPDGELRAWGKVCLRICLVLALPALFVIPLLVVIARGLVDLTSAGARICQNLLEIVLSVVVIAVVLLVAVKALKSRSRQAQSITHE